MLLQTYWNGISGTLLICPHLIVLILQETGLYLSGLSVAQEDAAAINQRNGDITAGRESCM